MSANDRTPSSTTTPIPSAELTAGLPFGVLNFSDGSLPSNAIAGLSSGIALVPGGSPHSTTHSASPSSTPPVGAGSLLDRIPPEVRLKIFGYVVCKPRCIVIQSAFKVEAIKKIEKLQIQKLSPPAEVGPLALARTCHRFRSEVVPQYFGQNEFAFPLTMDVYTFLSAAPMQFKSEIKKIIFYWTGPYAKEAFTSLNECVSLVELKAILTSQTMPSRGIMPLTDLWRAYEVSTLRKLRVANPTLFKLSFGCPVKDYTWGGGSFYFFFQNGWEDHRFDGRRFSKDQIMDFEEKLEAEIKQVASVGKHELPSESVHEMGRGVRFSKRVLPQMM